MDLLQEQLVSVIYDGVDFEDSRHLNMLYQAFQKNQEKNENLMEEECPQTAPGFEQLQRVLEMKRHFEWIPVPQEYHDRFQKSPEISTLLRERANKALYSTEVGADETKLLRGYNLAAAFAPPNSAELALALEKRADLLLRLNLPSLAQWDIHSVANNAAYPLKSLKSAQKLIHLQNRCSALVHANIGSAANGKRNGETRFVENKFYRLSAISESVENVADFCEIDYHPHCGRRIIVNKEVQPGEVIMVDEPYSIVLEKLLHWDLEHCTNCSRPVISGVPCDCCTFAWFCSNTCKTEANRGPHKFEKYLSYLKCQRIMSLKGILGARLLFKVGPDELYRIFQSKDPLFFQDDSSPNVKKGFNSKGIYTARTYLPIFHLISHVAVSMRKSKSNAFKALILTHLMEDTSLFFKRFRYNEDYEDFKNFISALLIRHMEAIEYNAITLSQLVPCQDDRDLKSTTLRYGAAVYPLLCLINHSCDPNCVPLRSLKFLKTCVIAMKSLKPGDEVTFSYAPHFSTMELQDRRKFLFDRYNFMCRCEACIGDWGVDSRSLHVPENQCNMCGHGRYLLSGQCPKCVLKDVKVRRDLPVFQAQAGEVKRLIERGEYLTGLEVVKPCLMFCYENLPHNFQICLQFQELFKMILVKLVNS